MTGYGSFKEGMKQEKKKILYRKEAARDGDYPSASRDLPQGETYSGINESFR
jgi:hypothetical protein